MMESQQQVDTSSSSLRPRSSRTQSKPAGRFGPDTAALPSPRGWMDGTRAHWTERTGETTQVKYCEWHRAFNGYVVVNVCVCVNVETHNKLSIRGQESGTVSFHGAVLPAEAELHSEPVQLWTQRREMMVTHDGQFFTSATRWCWRSMKAKRACRSVV